MSLAAIIGCVAIGFLLLFVEMFVPGGIIGILGGMLVIVGVVGAGVAYGSAVAFPLGLGCLVIGLVFLFLWAKYFPTSRFGSAFNLNAELGGEDGYTSQSESLSAYLGKTGKAVTDLKPGGVVRIEGKRLDVVTAGGFIDKGASIRVAKVDSNRVIVKKFDGTILDSNAPKIE